MNSYQFLIIGSGPGGTTVLKTLLENGLNDVAVVEEGQREQKTTMGSFDELINKYRYGGADIIYSKPNIAYAEGRTLGGGSEINSGLYHRIPENILSEWQTIIIFISVASMILGSVAAIGQNNIKRLFAYSSIGHMGYALAGVATGSSSGYASSVIYMTIYITMNIGAFGCIFLMKKDGKYSEEISDLSGISKNKPLLAISLLIILFSLAGVPPLAGFFAKFYIFMSVIENEMYLLAIIGLATTVISAFYYLKIIKIIYFDELKKPFDSLKSYKIIAPIFISCLILTTFFLYPSVLNEIVVQLF